jgi:hypothetical protein
MIESYGPRPAVPAGAAASLPAQAEEKIVHRPPTKVLPAERVDRNAPTGPRPAFEHTWLQRAAALWPEEPAPSTVPAPAPDQTDVPPQTQAARETIELLRQSGDGPPPAVDIRR